MTYPDDQLASELRGLGNDVALALDMAAETIHDHPEQAAAVLDGEEYADQHLVDQIREDHGLTLPVDGDLLRSAIQVSVNRVEKEEEA